MTILWFLVWIFLDAPASEDIPWWAGTLLGCAIVFDMIGSKKS